MPTKMGKYFFNIKESNKKWAEKKNNEGNLTRFGGEILKEGFRNRIISPTFDKPFRFAMPWLQSGDKDSNKSRGDTVDGRNPAPPGMYRTL